MAWCEECGLSSCYQRGGYCEAWYRRMKGRSPGRQNTMTIDSVKHVYASDLPPMLNSDEWIEYIPEPKIVKRKLAACRHGNELEDCDACAGGDRNR